MNPRWFIVLLTLLAGCARFHPQPISAGQNAANFDARDLESPALKTFLEKNLRRSIENWPLKSWDFETLTLAALYYHPSLAVARAQLQVALGGETTAAQHPNPTVTASPGYDFTATSLGLNPWIPGVTFDLPIETMGKRGYRKTQAKHHSDSVRLNITSAAWQVRDNLELALIDAVAAHQREEILQRQNDVQGKLARSLEEQFEAGAVSRFELQQVKIAQSKSELDLAEARRQSVDARIRVVDAIGISSKELARIHWDYDLSKRPVAAENLLTAEARDQALTHRADILGALADYAASESALQLQIARQYPDIHFGPYYQFNQGDHQFTLSVSAELPLLNQNQGPIAEARAARVEAAAHFNALQAKVISDIDRAVAGYRVAADNLKKLEGIVAAEKKQSDALTQQIKSGVADEFDWLTSQSELSASELAALDGRVKLQQSFAALEDAVQRPTAAPALSLTESAPARNKNLP